MTSQRPTNQRLTLTGPYSRQAPIAASAMDTRLQAAGAAENVLGGFFRGNLTLQPAEQLPYPTALTEYAIPNQDLVLRQPGPLLYVLWNRVELLPFESPDRDPATGAELDPGTAIPPGAYWLYRATLTDGTLEERLRLGTAPDPGDAIRAVYYIIDWTVAQ